MIDLFRSVDRCVNIYFLVEMLILWVFHTAEEHKYGKGWLKPDWVADIVGTRLQCQIVRSIFRQLRAHLWYRDPVDSRQQKDPGTSRTCVAQAGRQAGRQTGRQALQPTEQFLHKKLC